MQGRTTVYLDFYVTSRSSDLERANYYIVTVPTPTDKNNRPVLTPLIKASETIGKVLKPGDMVIYESTVYPGATEEDCAPVLERLSGLTFYNLHCLTRLPATHHYDAAILAVAHTLFTTIPLRTIASCIYDIKNVLPLDQVDGRL